MEYVFPVVSPCGTPAPTGRIFVLSYIVDYTKVS